MELRVQVELERSIDCSDSLWHTRHDETKYNRYEDNFKGALEGVCVGKDYVYTKTPGPKVSRRSSSCREVVL